jgi:hypothetical protein
MSTEEVYMTWKQAQANEAWTSLPTATINILDLSRVGPNHRIIVIPHANRHCCVSNSVSMTLTWCFVNLVILALLWCSNCRNDVSAEGVATAITNDHR